MYEQRTCEKWKSIYPASIPLMISILEKVKYAQSRGLELNKEKICKLISKGTTSISNGVKMLKNLDILRDISDIEIQSDILSRLKENISINEILASKVLMYEPFQEYMYLSKRLNSTSEAVNELKIVFSINTPANIIESNFNGWIKKLDINIDNIEEGLDSSIIVEVSDKASALLIIRSLFNQDFRDFPDQITNDLLEAIIEAQVNPRHSLTCSGRALEDFLRLKFTTTNLNRCNGLTQIADALNNLLSYKIINIIKGIAAIRSMGDSHGIDKREGKSWEISPSSAKIACYLVVKAMSCIDSYINDELLF